MQTVIIGSNALRVHAPQLFKKRQPADLDLVCDVAAAQDVFRRALGNELIEVTKKGFVLHDAVCPLEVEEARPGSTAELLLECLEHDATRVTVGGSVIPSLDMLYVLKMSHRFVKNSPHFWKTLFDYHEMRALGAKFPGYAREFFVAREAEQMAAQAHPKLNQNKESFFQDDNVTYVYDHDSIHEAVALDSRKPAYRKYSKDGEEVLSSKQKFFACPLDVQFAGVVEEAAVLAIERSLVPHPGVKTPSEAWFFALSKVMSSITSGWFRAFAYDNAPAIMRLYPDGYWSRFQQAVSEGKVRYA